MTTSIWYLLASLLLASAAGQLISGRSRSFYQNLESSSPAPRSSPSKLQQAEGEELIAYLTSEQVEVLKAAGAVVQPLPELENQFRQNDEERTGAQLRPTSTEDSREDREQENQALDIEQQERESEENLLEENQSADESLENSARNNKGTSQSRLRELSTLNTLRKLNKGRTQEIGKPKPKLNRNQPSSGNKLEDIKSNTESRRLSLAKVSESRQPVEIKNVDEFRQVVEDIKRYLSNNAEEVPEQADEPEEDVSDVNDNEPDTIQDRPQNPAEVWESAPVRESSKIRKNKEAEEKLKAAIENSRTIQRQYSSLSAPFVQQQRKTQRIVEQNDQLVIDEPVTSTKVEQTENDAETYAAEIQNLKDIVERIELAQKQSLEAAAKKTRTQQTKKSQEDTQNRRPAELENQDDSKPVLVKINKPLRWRWPARTENIRPVPIPVLLNENAKVRQSAVKIQRPIPVARQYYVNTGRPYLQKESDYKSEIPSSLAIIQRIWDN